LRFPAAFQRRPWSPMHIHNIDPGKPAAEVSQT
jgi:hypothetical protein